MVRRIPFNDRFYCVYQDNLAVYTHGNLTHCMRYIAKQMDSITGKVTMEQAMVAGFTIRSV